MSVGPQPISARLEHEQNEQEESSKSESQEYGSESRDSHLLSEEESGQESGVSSSDPSHEQSSQQ